MSEIKPYSIDTIITDHIKSVKEIRRVSKTATHVYVICNWRNVGEFKAVYERWFFKLKNILIWKIDSGYKMILFFSNGSKKLNGGRDANILHKTKEELLDYLEYKSGKTALRLLSNEWADVKKQEYKVGYKPENIIVDEPIQEVINDRWEYALPHLEDNSIDVVATDPPYGMSFQSNHRKEKHLEIVDDDNLKWLHKWVTEIKRVAKPDAHLFVFCSWHNLDVFKNEFESQGFKVQDILIWEKNNTGMGDLKGDYAPKYEMILFISNGKRALVNKFIGSVIKTARTQNKLHPTQKPVNLLKYLLYASGWSKCIVLDTFAGSFSTIKAAKELNMQYYGIEVEKKYCDDAKYFLEGFQKDLFSL